MKPVDTSSKIWLIGLLLSVVTPLIGGTLGCANRIGGLSPDNISWILICSLIPIALTTAISWIVIGIGLRFQRTHQQLLGSLIVVGLVSFIFTFQLVDNVSGI